MPARRGRPLMHRVPASVAVFQGRVIDHDADRVALLRRVRAMVGDEPVLITPADAEAPREFRLIGLRRNANL